MFDLEGDGIIFLKKMLEDTKISDEPNAHRRPMKFDADISNVHASMTPSVNGTKEI